MATAKTAAAVKAPAAAKTPAKPKEPKPEKEKLTAPFFTSFLTEDDAKAFAKAEGRASIEHIGVVYVVTHFKPIPDTIAPGPEFVQPE